MTALPTFSGTSVNFDQNLGKGRKKQIWHRVFIASVLPSVAYLRFSNRAPLIVNSYGVGDNPSNKNVRTARIT